MLNGSKTPEKEAAEKTLELVKGITDNVRSRLDNPIAPVLDAMTRHRCTIDMLSGAAIALTVAGHPLAAVVVSMTNMASQVGERALKDSVEHFERLLAATV